MVMTVFVVAAVLAIVSALVAVSHRDPVINVLSLVVTFFCVAVNFALLGANFLAAAQILVYAGALLVLFLFVIMLLGAPQAPESGLHRPVQKTAGLALAAIVIIGGVLLALTMKVLPPASPVTGDAREIGKAMLTTHAFSFELISVLLLAAMVGALMLVKRKH
ncbi:MAG: NADH-quinone oxidoreductase subunit J [Thermoanaerobaculaceae bacterium]|nr:NADH-quinone oxidoreductase subunit J [Thermoanaerobaculaceae bacterium]MDI9622943.1 NADH-quinone oxidoreductase subunit J [Acidobacteriota bacterium]NLH11862.1 NADH-quinone oxidoreductase subunit J [Holophagae bacterium]HPW56871.1 NADH-quinone oxidoreductase subunit J [Thermoanaerobaculaceae bacterium]